MQPFLKKSWINLVLKPGDELNVVVTSEGIQLIPYDSNFQEALLAYKQGAAQYRNAMRELADG